MLWEHELQASVSTGFSNSPNFHECSYNSIEKRGTCFLLLLENNATKNERNLFTLIIKLKIVFARAIITSTAQGSSVFKRTQHVAPNNIAICCVGMLRSFGRGFTVILVPRAYDPSGLRQESRALGASISGMRHR